jgi:hypothetical protein
MNGNKKIFDNTYIDKVYHYGNVIVKTALIVVIVTMTISTILLAIYGRLDDKVYTWQTVFIFNSISGSMWILASAPVYLLSMAIYNRYAGKSAPIKKMFVLLLIAVFAATAFLATAVLLKVWTE